jgi:CubicO group peptidase (beta-lactamase class C family)
MKRREALATLSALATLAMTPPGPASAAGRREPFADVLDAELGAIARDEEAPLASLATLVVRGGRVVYEGHFGRRFIDPVNHRRDRPAQSTTLYRIASLSKLVVTLGVLRLVEQGRLDLDADAGSYLGYALRNPHFPGAPVTLRMMLCHTSSLRDDGGYFWDERADLREVLVPGGSLHRTGAMWSPKAPPGAYFQYANFSWGVIGTVMEKATGERFDRLMHRLVLEPLGLQGGFSPADFPRERLGHLATLYRKRSNADDNAAWFMHGAWIPQVDDYSTSEPVPRAGTGYVPGTNGTLYGPQGNLRATAGDLGRVMRMLMGGGELDGKRFLDAKRVDEMLSVQWRYADATSGQASYGSAAGRFNAWGLGCQHFMDHPGGDRLVDGGGFTAIGHLGDAWGLIGTFAFNRETKDGVIFLCGGTGFDPRTRPGIYSSFFRFEERILTALHQRALRTA